MEMFTYRDFTNHHCSKNTFLPSEIKVSAQKISFNYFKRFYFIHHKCTAHNKTGTANMPPTSIYDLLTNGKLHVFGYTINICAYSTCIS
jgi:hypothetical protein